MAFQKLAMFAYFLQILAFVAGHTEHHKCKAVPGSKDWPKINEWAKLNHTLSGRLIKTIPPGGVCHPSYPTFDPVACPAVIEGWKTNLFHVSNPVSSLGNHWNNDTCLPYPTFPCSGDGYPVYVINATKPEHVKKGVDFARKNNVRLIVKGSGHDYLGRSSAPNSLSIWTHHMQGLKFHKEGKFRLKNCRSRVKTAAITVAAGVPMIDINEQAQLHNLTIVSGGAATVGVGGYITGAGHGAISSVFGLAADQVVEMQLVTPGGDIITANECHNKDLFWAMRGGGGSTFGVMTSVTIKAFPSFKFAFAYAFFGTPVGERAAYHESLTTIFSHYPSLSSQSISGYTFAITNLSNDSDIGLPISLPVPFPINGYLGLFSIPLLHPENTTESLKAAVESVFTDAKKGFPHPETTFLSSVTTIEFPNFYTYFKDNNGPQGGGDNGVMGSWLLDGKALTGDREKLKHTLEELLQEGVITAHLISGKGVHDTSQVSGGGNAVNPAWRKAYAHTITGTSWPPLSPPSLIASRIAQNNHYVDILRNLAPDSGAYINEANAYQPDFQHVFWGKNYKRLLEIKRRVDPKDVFWCRICVGSEGWEEVDGGRVCRVGGERWEV